MTTIAKAIGVATSNLSTRMNSGSRPRGPYLKVDDGPLTRRIEIIIKQRPSYGYRRVTAILNREPNHDRVNHKRVYRVMKANDLLLGRSPYRVTQTHEGTIITLKSNLRWCSDALEFRCWNGDKVYMAFSLDCCDREAISYVAKSTPITGTDIRDLMAQSVEKRFSAMKTPCPVQWLSDNGPPFAAHETRAFGKACGFTVCNTPSYSPESNGMAEAFVKTLKRDYVYLADLPDAETALQRVGGWFADYNEHHPHKGLKMLSPRQFRRIQSR
jgi:transposase InsO family protein